MKPARALLFLAVIACGHKPPPSGGGPVTGDGGSGEGPGSGSASGTGGGSGSAGPAADAPLSRDECTAMLGHIFDLGIAEKKKTWTADQTPTTDELAASRAKLIDANLQECMQLPRAQYACAIRATTANELQACPQ